MDVELIQIDAFAERPFEGNPAAVMPLPHWLDESLLQQVAAENNLSETAFVVGCQPRTAGAPAYDLRWFTPAIEVDLCGHATLAAGAFLLDDRHPAAARIDFRTRSGWLSVERAGEGLVSIDLPAQRPAPLVIDPDVPRALGVDVLEALLATDLICVLADPDAVLGVRPDLAALAGLGTRGVMVTAAADPASGWDFVSRWFGPGAGVPEDPVTGSAHAQAVPYWSTRLGKDILVARQLSARGGTLYCRLAGDRVVLTGGYRRYLTGIAHLPTPPRATPPLPARAGPDAGTRRRGW